jgi:hypothetical protein
VFFGFGTVLASPYGVGLIRITIIMSVFLPLFQGYDGFEELRKYIKHGNEFSKEVSAVLQER